MNHKADSRPIRKWLDKHYILIPFIVLALAVSIAFYLNDRNQTADQIARCKNGVDTRNVDRAQVQAFYVFVTDSLPSPEETKDLTLAQKDEVREYRTRLESYRTDLYKLIRPSELCAKYVDDDNVKPPKSPKIIIPKNQKEANRP